MCMIAPVHIRICLNLFSSPKVRPAVDQVEDLSWVEELLELAEELDPLVVSAFGVDEDQERAGARRGGGLPEA